MHDFRYTLEKIIQENCELLRENQELKAKTQESNIDRRKMAVRFAEGIMSSGTRLHWSEKSIAIYSVRCADRIEEELSKQRGKKDGEVWTRVWPIQKHEY